MDMLLSRVLLSASRSGNLHISLDCSDVSSNPNAYCIVIGLASNKIIVVKSVVCNELRGSKGMCVMLKT